MGRDSGGIWFRSATPMVFQMQPVNTLEELKAVILRNMGVAGRTMLVRRVAYRLLNIFPPNQFKFKIFWVDGDEHVRGMFDLHRRYGTREVMELLTEMQTMGVDVGGSSRSVGGDAAVIPCSPIDFTGPKVPVQSELNDDEDSDEEYVGETEESSGSSDGTEFVPESQCRRGTNSGPGSPGIHENVVAQFRAWQPRNSFMPNSGHGSPGNGTEHVPGLSVPEYERRT
ncbi:hypothetical protein PIB30_048576 [Stylosanthes scabra]|uniref:Uncharacterized protein n=1 Tax=Stylosanthes scabra TaxID=79078 RepID=A0ABU6XEW9_9FABA|nr:hypothetical protein [Stylosanthes scabra]